MDKLGCTDCQDTGIKYSKCEYPWGGYDMIPEFCQCLRGQQESVIQHREHGYGEPRRDVEAHEPNSQ